MRFSKPVTLFKIFGFEIKADSSWLFLSVLITWTLMNSIYPIDFPGYEMETYRHMAVWSLFGLIVSIIAHELAHAVIAEYYDMPVVSIRLFIFGGVAEFKGRPSHPRGEFFMAIAGPVMSFLLGVFFWATHIVLSRNFGINPFSQSFQYLGYINFVLAFFNLLPAFPLDGGRALRALVWHRKKNLVLATRFASSIGEFFAYALIGYGCYRLTYFDDPVGALWMGMLGVFMLGAGQYAVRQTESWSLLEGQSVRDFMSVDYVSVSPDLNLTDFVDEYVYKFYQQAFPVVDGHKLVGMIDVHTIMQQDRKKWGWTHVSSQMRALQDLYVIDADAPAAEALDTFTRLGAHALLVTQDKKLLGILDHSSITNYLSIMMKLERAKIIKNSV